MRFIRSWWSRRWLRVFLYVGALCFLLVMTTSMVVERTLCKGGYWDGPVTDHFDGKHFFNPEIEDEPWNGAFLWWRLTRDVEPFAVVPENADQPELASSVEEREWEATMVNHSTLLIRLHGVTILTDPVWSERVSPVSGVGPERFRPVGIEWEKLPKVDVVLVTHDHYDHLDIDTLKKLNERFYPQFYVSLGNKALLEENGIRNVVELDWWEEAVFSAEKSELKITLTPARHFSGRYRTDAARNRTLWAGFYLQNADGVNMYFAGDTAWTRFFGEIRERLGKPDVAFLPVGAYKPQNLMAPAHISPEQAVKAHKVLEAEKSIAMHFGTWQLADDGYEQILSDLKQGLEKEGVSAESFAAPNNGKTLRGVKK